MRHTKRKPIEIPAMAPDPRPVVVVVVLLDCKVAANGNVEQLDESQGLVFEVG